MDVNENGDDLIEGNLFLEILQFKNRELKEEVAELKNKLEKKKSFATTEKDELAFIDVEEEKSRASPFRNENHLGTDINEPNINEEIIDISSDDEDGYSLDDMRSVKLQQQVSQLDKEKGADAEGDEETETEIEESAETDENGKADKQNGEDLMETSANEANEMEPVVAAPPTGRPFSCQVKRCTSSFKNRCSLIQHKIVHSTRFQCHVCQKCFKSWQELERHLPVHSDARPFVCSWAGCVAEFKRQYQLDQHLTTVHSDERRFLCQEKDCGKLFKTKKRLRQHQHYHSPLRPFPCQEEGCDKRFKMRCDLAKHQNYVHSDERKFRCHIKRCKKTFKDRHGLARHLKIHF